MFYVMVIILNANSVARLVQPQINGVYNLLLADPKVRIDTRDCF